MLRRTSRLAVVAAMLAAWFAGGPVYAVGYWNVPGNVAQWWGYGWGAGHHACFVLGPVSHQGAFAHNQMRLRYAPQPPCGCYGSCASSYDFRQPAQYVPVNYQPTPTVATPEPEPMPAPQTATPDPLPLPGGEPAPGAIFAPPVEP